MSDAPDVVRYAVKTEDNWYLRAGGGFSQTLRGARLFHRRADAHRHTVTPYTHHRGARVICVYLLEETD